MNADKYQTQNDVTKYKAYSTQQTNAFCLSRYANQSLAIAPYTTNSNPVNSRSNINPIYKSSSQSFQSNNFNIKKPFVSILKPQNNSKSQSNPPFSKSPKLHNLQKVFVTTRQNPQTDTFLRPIVKRKREPNKPKMENTSKTFTTSSTQTEGTSNKGMGKTPIRADPDIVIYPLGNQANMPEYRKNLHQIFGEEFLAEATLKDKQLAPKTGNGIQ